MHMDVGEAYFVCDRCCVEVNIWWYCQSYFLRASVGILPDWLNVLLGHTELLYNFIF